jgi:uncharacterized membrane protein required for colicin V production
VIIDIGAVALIILGAFVGYRRRLSGELARLISLIAGFCLGMVFYQPVAIWMLNNSRLEGRAAQAAAFVVMMIAASVVMVIVRIFLKKIMRVVIEEESDKICGAIAGLIRGSIFVIVLFLIANIVPHDYINYHFGEGSYIGRTVSKCIPKLEKAIEDKLNERESE